MLRYSTLTLVLKLRSLHSALKFNHTTRCLKLSAPHCDEHLDFFFLAGEVGLAPCGLIAGELKTEATRSSESLYPPTIHGVTNLKTAF